ncbi:hypothetical protein RRG08_065631 [Elysia crispata]|uniref:Uncharacterized protein n=1 Tax=Elysia crispata TaxID=231223 RepID=A0AAE0YMZ9_9GAST|nr:hypothetical protein RRG08_065631 [Elysia crispata]
MCSGIVGCDVSPGSTHFLVSDPRARLCYRVTSPSSARARRLAPAGSGLILNKVSLSVCREREHCTGGAAAGAVMDPRRQTSLHGYTFVHLEPLPGYPHRRSRRVKNSATSYVHCYLDTGLKVYELFATGRSHSWTPDVGRKCCRPGNAGPSSVTLVKTRSEAGCAASIMGLHLKLCRFDEFLMIARPVLLRLLQGRMINLERSSHSESKQWLDSRLPSLRHCRHDRQTGGDYPRKTIRPLTGAAIKRYTQVS